MNLPAGIAVVFIVVLVVAVVALGYKAWTERQDRRRFPPPGRLVDVGGRQLHLLVSGDEHASPTVILDAVMVSFSSNWAWVQPELAKVVRVVAYDRTGLGWSDPGPRPRDAGQSEVRSGRPLRPGANEGVTPVEVRDA